MPKPAALSLVTRYLQYDFKLANPRVLEPASHDEIWPGSEIAAGTGGILSVSIVCGAFLIL
jgi:hypothetical protein